MIKVSKINRILSNVIVMLLFVLMSVLYVGTGGFEYVSAYLGIQREIPIYSVDMEEKKIALTFDVATGLDNIDEILDILDKNNVRTTFFIVGSWIDSYEEKAIEIYKKGHEIENHSDSHPHFTKISSEKIKEEVFKMSSKVEKITGKGTTLFRAPYGDYNGSTVKVVKETGHYFVQWDVDSIDWKNPGEEFIYKRIMDKTGPGSILLFHNVDQTPKVLGRIIKDLKAKGFEFVRVSELIIKDNFYIDHTGRQKPILNKNYE